MTADEQPQPGAHGAEGRSEHELHERLLETYTSLPGLQASNQLHSTLLCSSQLLNLKFIFSLY